jgi:hypothetical protein
MDVDKTHNNAGRKALTVTGWILGLAGIVTILAETGNGQWALPALIGYIVVTAWWRGLWLLMRALPWLAWLFIKVALVVIVIAMLCVGGVVTLLGIAAMPIVFMLLRIEVPRKPVEIRP